jgi:hypothetical protein
MFPIIGSGRGPGGLGYLLRQVRRRRMSTARKVRMIGIALEVPIRRDNRKQEVREGARLCAVRIGSK